MQRKLAQVADALLQKVEKLDSSGKAEAIWTEMYDYLGDSHSTFYKETYQFEGLTTAAYAVFGILNRNNQPVRLDWIDHLDHAKQRGRHESAYC